MIGQGTDIYLQLYQGKNKPKEYFLGFLGQDATIQDILNAYNLAIADGEIPVLSIAVFDAATKSYIIKKYLVQLVSGGTYAPLGDYATEKSLILIETIYTNGQTVESAITAVNAEVLPEFELDSPDGLLAYLNESVAPVDVSDESKIYYFKFTTPGGLYYYVLSENTVRGIYGQDNLQFADGDLVQFYTDTNSGNEIDYVRKAELGEIEIAGEDILNDVNPQGKSCLAFTNASGITGIDTSGLTDGQIFSIYNATNDLFTVYHLNDGSVSGNQVYVGGETDLILQPKSWVIVIYSLLRKRLEIINVFGTGFMPSLVNGGDDFRVVTVGPSGILFSEEIIDYLVYDDTEAGYATLAALVAAYPTANGYKRGFTVVCRLADPPCFYRKDSDGDERWTKHVGEQMV